MGHKDTLHTINEVYNAVKHLPVPTKDSISNVEILKEIVTLKTKPKSFVEEYGVILGASIGILSAGLTSLLNHLFQTHRDKKQKEKEIDFKNIDVENKKQETLMNIYSEASKYQKSYISITRAYYRLRIRHSFLQARIRILQPGEVARKQSLEQQLELVMQGINVRNENILSELKHYTAEMARYNFHKKGNTQVKDHLTHINRGISFVVDTTFSDLNNVEQIDALYYSEKRRFIQYWHNEIKVPTETALNNILTNT